MIKELDDILAICAHHTGVYAQTFFPDIFFTEFSVLHEQIITALDSSAQQIVIAAPRGLGKTSIVRAVCSKAISYREYQFILYVSRTETLAMMQTENLKRDLLANREIRKVFGEVKINDKNPEIEESFSRHSWVAHGETLVMPRGGGQQVRSLLYGSSRPQLIIVDDFEDREELTNPENREKNKHWFYSDLRRCVDNYSKNWRIIYIDTLKHAESLLQELLDSPDWLSLRLELFDDNYKSNVPALFSDAEILKEVEAAKRTGTLDILYMEMRNMPVARETQSFKPEYFQYYDSIDLKTEDLESVVLIDPAKTIQIQNADTAIVGLYIDYKSGRIYFHDCESGKMYPDEIYERSLEMARRLQATAIGIEVTGLDEFIKQPFLNAMSMKGPQYSFEIVWLKARGGDPGGERGKLKRIGALLPFYRQGYILHNRRVCGKLETQLLNFPRSGLVDVADATAYVIEMLEMGNRYFFSKPNKNAKGEEEDEFAELEAGDFRSPIRVGMLI